MTSLFAGRPGIAGVTDGARLETATFDGVGGMVFSPSGSALYLVRHRPHFHALCLYVQMKGAIEAVKTPPVLVFSCAGAAAQHMLTCVVGQGTWVFNFPVETTGSSL